MMRKTETLLVVAFVMLGLLAILLTGCFNIGVAVNHSEVIQQDDPIVAVCLPILVCLGICFLMAWLMGGKGSSF
jgi:uncharacterized membrane protein AbrB (regulator of aidB expression)